jgi:hypothetical protein
MPQNQQALVAAAPSFVSSLTPTEKALFGSYLTHTVFPHVHGSKFPQGVPDLSIFEVFDQVELQWYYRYWKKQVASRMQSAICNYGTQRIRTYSPNFRGS